MAKLPDFNALGERPPPQPARRTPMVANFRGTTGMEGFGSEVASHSSAEMRDAAAAAFTAKEHQDTLIAEDAYNKLQEKRLDLEWNAQSGFRNVQGAAAMSPKFFEDNVAKLEGETTKLADGLDDAQREKFMHRAAIAGLQYRGALLQHKAHETNVFNDNAEANGVEIRLKNMALNWGDDIAFATGMAEINGILSARGMRKNLPVEQTEVEKAKVFDEAWGTRVKAAMNSDPLRAEAMFKRVEPELSAKARLVLGHELKAAVMPVRAKNAANGILTAPKTEDLTTQLVVGGEPLINAVRIVESNNNDAAVSPKGAKGASQVLDSTNYSPGFGVTPAQNDSPEERNRVGKDYLAAMETRYGGNRTLALAAYNAGPGKVDEWIAKFGDPRTGAISDAEFVKSIPFKETREYVPKVLTRFAGMGGDQPAVNARRETRAMLATWESQVRIQAAHDYPNDPVASDLYVSEVKGRVATITAAQEAIQRQNQGVVLNAVWGIGGGKVPLTFSELTANPQIRQALIGMDVGMLNGVRAMLDHNQREANGEFIRSNPTLVKDLHDRMFLDENDPRKLRSVTELVPYFSNGLNRSDYDWLKKELETPDKEFQKNKKRFVDQGVKRMSAGLVGRMLAEAQPEVIQQAGFNFELAVDKRIDEVRKEGKDVRSVLFDPKSPEYILRPGYVESFLPSQRQALGDAANRVRANPPADVVTVANDADFNKLKPGTRYKGPDGVVRQK